MDSTKTAGSGQRRTRTVAYSVPAERAKPANYLESNGKIVDQPGESRSSTRLEVVAHKCKSRFCDECAERMGFILRGKLRSVLKTFESVQMWTLTIDPKLFLDAEDAYRYVREKRCISEWVRSLHKRGWLNSRRYFAAVEYHKSGYVHFHVVVDTDYVPFQIAAICWNRFRPAGLPVPEGTRPGFGSIRFSKGRGARDGGFASGDHAANYVTKYVIKPPEEGWPDWVLDFEGQIHRFQTSRGFWGPSKESRQQRREPDEKCAADCFCAVCRGEVGEKKPQRRTPRERIDSCKFGGASVVAITEEKQADGSVVVKHSWLGTSMLGWYAILESGIFGVDEEYDGTRLAVTIDQAMYLTGKCVEDYALANQSTRVAKMSTQKYLNFDDWLDEHESE